MAALRARPVRASRFNSRDCTADTCPKASTESPTNARPIPRQIQRTAFITHGTSRLLPSRTASNTPVATPSTAVLSNDNKATTPRSTMIATSRRQGSAKGRPATSAATASDSAVTTRPVGAGETGEVDAIWPRRPTRFHRASPIPSAFGLAFGPGPPHFLPFFKSQNPSAP